MKRCEDQKVRQMENQGSFRGEETGPSKLPQLEVSCTRFPGVGSFSHWCSATAHRNPSVRPGPGDLTFCSEKISHSVQQNNRKLVRRFVSRTYPTIQIAPYHSLPAVQSGLSGCACILGDVFSAAIRTHFGIWTDIGGGA